MPAGMTTRRGQARLVAAGGSIPPRTTRRPTHGGVSRHVVDGWGNGAAENNPFLCLVAGKAQTGPPFRDASSRLPRGMNGGDDVRLYDIWFVFQLCFGC